MAQRKLATWLGTLLGLMGALVVAQAHGEELLKAEFHQTYTVNAGAMVSLENINGGVHISAWDKNEVKVDAVKSAWSQRRLDDAKISVDADAGSVSIRTEYSGHENTFNSGDHDNPASVEYTLTVPRGARLEEINLINGGLDIEGVQGEIEASCINGRLTARGLTGEARLSTINGILDAQVERVNNTRLELSSINGRVLLTLPSDTKAELEASTVHGSIDSEFGIHVHRQQLGGHNFRAELGGGGKLIKLDNVNGTIEVKHASDGKAMSPAKDLERGGDDDEI